MVGPAGADDPGLGELGEELGMFRRIFDPGVADDLEARALRVIHQEERDPVVHGEVAGGEELAVAFVIGEGEERWIQRAQKTGRAPIRTKALTPRRR